MPQPYNAPVTTQAALNFAADRSPGGIWSNQTPHLRTQRLAAETVTIRDARTLASVPGIGHEGFQLEYAPLENYAWEDDRWVRDVYLSHGVALIQALTRAPHVTPLHPSILIRDSSNRKGAPAADFVHLDQSRESAIPFLDTAINEAARKRYPRVKIFNLWRVLTPPPQDVPLALCDQRTINEADWTVGRTIEPQIPEGVVYISSVFNADQRWYYFSDLTVDDVVIFKGYDNHPAAPMGCLHGAFRHPDPPLGAVPRASAEMRIAALFEA